MFFYEMFTMKRFYLFMIIGLLFVSMSRRAGATWTFEFFCGSVYNMKTPLDIHQSGYKRITLNARYESKSFEPPLYYDIRIARWNGKCAWEFEFVHQKLYLKNKPPEVQNFSISHGYNIFTVNRAWSQKGFVLHSGAGMVIAHPETIVRKKRYSDTGGLFHKGYYISGPAFQMAVGKGFSLWKRLFITIEGKFIGSYTLIPVQDGNADVLNVSFHGIFGLRCNL